MARTSSVEVNVACRITDADGRCTNLLRLNEIVAGRYKMRFEVKKYFTLGLHDTFYPFIEVSESKLQVHSVCFQHLQCCV
jgi:5-hydroxyisourate hydrolase-like protein (transthyretin family)